MRIAPLHAKEKERIEELYACSILDTPPELKFDLITKLAAKICNVPMATVSLIDVNRQWFKSFVGLDICQTDRDVAFCSHAIHQTEIMQVKNALEDERFSDNPLVTESPKIRFYAGVPLISAKGLPLGTLCVLDQIPRELTGEQQEQLTMLATQVVDILEVRIKNTQLEKMKLELERSNCELRVKSEQVYMMAKKHFLQDLAFGVLDQIAVPLQLIKDEIDQAQDSSDLDLKKMNDAYFDINLIVKTLSLVAQDQTGPQPKEKFDLARAIDVLLKMASHSLAKRNIQVFSYVPPGSFVFGNRMQISQVLMQLLKNSVDAFERYPKEVKEITLSLKVKDDRMCLQFSDNGPGVSEESKSFLFRATTVKNGFEKASLGLFQARSYMLENEGEINLVEGSSSTFEIKIPKSA